jgi:UDP-glucose:(heptosyl)LPS alpha-1,3-glucosyltransferase
VNIGFVVHHYDPTDGTGGYAVEIVNRLAQDNAITLYASALQADPPANVTVVRVPSLGGSAYARILSFPLGFSRVRRSHDVVHAQGWVTETADVVTVHIVLQAWRDAARRAGVVPPPGERLLGGFVAARERRLVAQGTRLVIAPSARAQADVARCYGRTTGVTVVHHGFPAPAPLRGRDDTRRTLGLPGDGFIALYAGDPRKGLDRALTALVDASHVHLLVASRSDPRPHLRRARELGIAARVHWPATVGDMRTAYGAADLLFHPTIYDTFAMVVAEALAYGVPVAVSPEAGVTDLVEHGRSAWVLASDGSDAVAALNALKTDTELRRRLVENGRAVASRRSWDIAAQETLAVYRQAASSPRSCMPLR